MKKLITILTLTLFFQFAHAQQEVWLDIGLKGGYGMSLLYNKNLWDDSGYNHQFSSGNGFGGRFGVNFGYNHGISIEAMSRRLSQDFEYNVADPITGTTATYHNDIKWKNIDLYLLYRPSSSRVYMELGPMFSLVRKVEQEDELFIPSGEVNIQDFYAQNYVSGVFGFGGFLVGDDTFSLNFGFRLHYAFQDFVSEQGRASFDTYASFPTPGLGVNANYDPYKSTNPLYAEVSIELSIGIGRFAKASCSKRMHFIWSGNR